MRYSAILCIALIFATSVSFPVMAVDPTVATEEVENEQVQSCKERYFWLLAAGFGIVAATLILSNAAWYIHFNLSPEYRPVDLEYISAICRACNSSWNDNFTDVHD